MISVDFCSQITKIMKMLQKIKGAMFINDIFCSSGTERAEGPS
jgi:hypothetical protein